MGDSSALFSPTDIEGIMAISLPMRFAAAIHQRSKRQNRPYVPVNMGGDFPMSFSAADPTVLGVENQGDGSSVGKKRTVSTDRYHDQRSYIYGESLNEREIQ